VDLDECVSGDHNCHSYEVCSNLQNGNGWKCGPSDAECSSEVSAAEWKGVMLVKKYILIIFILAKKYEISV
jgi:hypothetical protein